MDRINIYVGKSTSDCRIDKFDQDDMLDLSKVISAMLGSAPVASGLTCTPTSVASMFVDIAPGEIYQALPLAATVCDKDDDGQAVLKRGIARDSVVVPNADTGVTALVAPEIAGQSINYLIEATCADADVSTDPKPNCCDADSNIFKKGRVALTIKAGTAAAAGSQVTPDVDSGYVGLWVVTLAYGETAINAANITAYAETDSQSASVPASVLESIQSGNLQYGIDVSTTANVIQGAFPTPPTALVDNQIFWVKVKNSNTGAVTFTPNAGVIGAAPVVGAAHVALQGGECVVNGRALLVWRADIASYVLAYCTGGALQVAAGSASQHAATLAQVQSGLSAYAIDAGSANTYAVALSPALTAYVDGVKIRFRALTANTGASTLNVNGLGAVALVGGAHAALAGGEIVAGGYCEAEYNGAMAKFVLLECTGAPLQVAAASSSRHAAQLSQLTGVVGSMRNAQMSVQAAVASGIPFTADEIIVSTALGGLQYRLGSFSQEINLTKTGAGGMDTGTAPASGYVALYAIYNPTTAETSILATNATLAAVGNVYGGSNMPSGYTASALVSVWPTTSAGLFSVGVQIDRSVSFPSVIQLDYPAVTAVTSLALNVPYNARSVSGYLKCTSPTTGQYQLNIYADTNTSGYQVLSGYVPSSNSIFGNFSLALITKKKAFWNTNTIGFTATIGISAYSF